MTGVEILNQFEVVTKTVFSWESFWWGALIGAVIGLITAIIRLVYILLWSRYILHDSWIVCCNTSWICFRATTC